MIDIWMLFTMTVPFLEIILHTTMEVLKRPRETGFGPSKVDVIRVKSAKEQEGEEEEEKEETKNMNRASIVLMRLMLPISSLIFIFTFWTVGLIASFSSDATQDHSMTECLTIDID